MEHFHTVPVGNEQYVVIAIDPDARTARWVKPEEGQECYKSRQAAAWHRGREEKKMTTRLSSWIGAEGRLFERVSLVFEGLGYQPPALDTTTDGIATGTYVGNIQNQYSDFTTNEILQIVDYAKSCTLNGLQIEKEQGWIDRESVFGERS